MAKRYVILLTVTLLMGHSVFAQLQSALDGADAAYEEDDYEESIAILEEALTEADDGAEEAELYWRLSRATLSLGDRRKDAGAEEDLLLPIFEEGERYADRAIEADSRNHLGYYWKAANIGRWGQAKGILNSLFKAAPMRDLLTEAIELEPEHADSYYVLSQLYAQVPGLISFGNSDYAVSLARRALDLHGEQLASGQEDERREGYDVKLAAALIGRDWNARKRNREQDGKAEAYRDAESELERGFYYEGIVEIPRASDEEEARSVLDAVIGELQGRDGLSEQEERQLTEALELRESL